MLGDVDLSASARICSTYGGQGRTWRTSILESIFCVLPLKLTEFLEDFTILALSVRSPPPRRLLNFVFTDEADLAIPKAPLSEAATE